MKDLAVLTFHASLIRWMTAAKSWMIRILQSLSAVYTDGGYHLLGMADQGFRIMSTNKPVYSWRISKGRKIRTMENSYHLAF